MDSSNFGGNLGALFSSCGLTKVVTSVSPGLSEWFIKGASVLSLLLDT
jgi:hypothetical protein